MAEIEKRLRQQDPSSFSLYLSPLETYWGLFSIVLAPLAYLSYVIADTVCTNVTSSSPFSNDTLSTWRYCLNRLVTILYWSVFGPVCLAFLLLMLAIGISAVAFFLAVYPIPQWFFMFGHKWLLHGLRFIAMLFTFLTPVLILAFLFYSPVCKRVTDSP